MVSNLVDVLGEKWKILRYRHAMMKTGRGSECEKYRCSINNSLQWQTAVILSYNSTFHRGSTPATLVFLAPESISCSSGNNNQRDFLLYARTTCLESNTSARSCQSCWFRFLHCEPSPSPQSSQRICVMRFGALPRSSQETSIYGLSNMAISWKYIYIEVKHCHLTSTLVYEKIHTCHLFRFLPLNARLNSNLGQLKKCPKRA